MRSPRIPNITWFPLFFLLLVIVVLPFRALAINASEDDLLIGKLQYERDLERRINSLLLSIVGPEKAKVTVSLDINSEMTSRREETVHSETNTQIIVLDNGMQEEGYDSGEQGKPKSGATSQAGNNITDETRVSKEIVTLPAGVIKKMVTVFFTVVPADEFPDVHDKEPSCKKLLGTEHRILIVSIKPFKIIPGECIDRAFRVQ